MVRVGATSVDHRFYDPLWVRYANARIVCPHRSLKLRRINFLAPRPLDKVGRTIRWVGAPPLEHVGIYRFVYIDVTSVVSNIGLLANGSIKRRKNPSVHSRSKGLIRIGDFSRHIIAIKVHFGTE